MHKPQSNLVFFVSIAVIVVGFLSFNRVMNYARPGENLGRVPCINPALPIPAELHIHPRLKISVNGSNVPIPPNIGLTFSCERAIHTHDSSGEIHIEPNFPADFRLGDFFSVWGKPFSRSELLEHRVGDSHLILMTVDGMASDEYGGLVLKDGQEIALEYKQK